MLLLMLPFDCFDAHIILFLDTFLRILSSCVSCKFYVVANNVELLFLVCGLFDGFVGVAHSIVFCNAREVYYLVS